MRNQSNYSITTLSAAGASEAIYIEDFRNTEISVSTTSSTNLTFTLVGSAGEDAPDFGSVASASNFYDTVAFVPINNGAQVDGDTGVVIVTTETHRIYEANINGLNWLALKVTSFTAGTVSADFKNYDNS